MASGETRASTSPIHESEHTHTGPLGAGPASKISSPVVGLSRQESGGHDHDWRGSRGNEAGSQVTEELLDNTGQIYQMPFARGIVP